MLNCKQFAVLPTEVDVAEWFGDHLFTGEVAGLLGKVGGLDIEEREKRIMVQLSSDQDVEGLLARMGEDGVPWPGFLDPITNELIKIRGYPADKNILRITLLDVPRDVDEETVRGVMAQYGRVEEVKRHHLAKAGMEHISVNRVSVRLTKDRELELPTTIFGLGSSTNGDDRSIWRVTYSGAPRRCYRCGHADHLARECRRQAITMKQVEKLPAVGEIGQHEDPEQPSNSVPRTFACVVKSVKFREREEEQTLELERLKQDKLTKKIQEDRRRAEEKADREAAKLAEEARKKIEAEEKRAANLIRLVEVSNQAAAYKEKVKSLKDKTEKELEESRSYEKVIEAISTGHQGDDPEGRKRAATSPTVNPQAKKAATDPQNGGSNI